MLRRPWIRNSGSRFLTAMMLSIVLVWMHSARHPRVFGNRRPIRWHVRSDMCLNSDTIETPISGDAQESRTILTKNNETHHRWIGAVFFGHPNSARGVRMAVLGSVFFLPMALSVEFPAHLFSHSLSG